MMLKLNTSSKHWIHIYMNDYPTVISYYTHTWKYPNYAKKMQVACKNLGVECHIVPMPDTGWIDNTKKKPKFILDVLKELKRPVLWIDVDGTLYKTPDLFVGGYEYDWAAKRKRSSSDRTWHVGTMYFAYNPRVIRFIEAWVDEADKMDGSDELALEMLWRKQEPVVTELVIDELPVEYFQMLNANQPDALRNTVIGHRASDGDSKRNYMKKKELTQK